MEVNRSDLAGGLLAGLAIGLGVGLLLVPRRGQALGAWQNSEMGRRLAASGPLIFEAGLVVLTQLRPTLGRLAWGLVQLAGRSRPRGGEKS